MPLSAVLYGTKGASVQVVVDGKVQTRHVETGLEASGKIAIKSGVAAGEIVVAKAGTFLRDGDAVRAILPKDAGNDIEKLSEAVR